MIVPGLFDSVSVYLHIPFCKHHCPYCGFFKQTDTHRQSDYQEALIRDIDAWGKALGRVRCPSVFIGGGTPNLLEPEWYVPVFEKLHAVFNLSSQTEVTMEMNPEGISLSRLNDLYSLGVNRLSLGVQSFDSSSLAFLERDHSKEQLKAVFDVISQSPFRNYSADLMYGLPHESESSINQTLDFLLSQPITHLSTYYLSIEPGTPFAKRGIQPLTGSSELACYERIRNRVTQAGFSHYEISNFAKPGFECLHNNRYWHLLPYIGIGPSASGYLDCWYYKNPSHLEDYLRHSVSPVLKNPSLFCHTHMDVAMDYWVFLMVLDKNDKGAK